MKIGILDDHPMINQGISELVSRNFSENEVIFTCCTRTDLFLKIRENSPDILILDIVVPDVTGLELFEKIRNDFPSIKMIAHTALTSPVLVENLLLMDVRGYINKRQPEDEIVSAIKKVGAGEIYVPGEYRFIFNKRNPLKENSSLSEREKEIMNLITSELTSSEIAEKLGISVNTVENHRKNIFQKLKVKNSVGMVMEATRLGYLS